MWNDANYKFIIHEKIFKKIVLEQKIKIEVFHFQNRSTRLLSTFVPLNVYVKFSFVNDLKELKSPQGHQCVHKSCVPHQHLRCLVSSSLSHSLFYIIMILLFMIFNSLRLFIIKRNSFQWNFNIGHSMWGERLKWIGW